MMGTPRILLTNDDGINAEGLRQLYLSLKEVAEVTVIAPFLEQSATGHAITISDPIRVWKVQADGETYGWAVSGTPSDCVKIGIKVIVDFPPDLVISGINFGSNMGTNVIYSGTVAAAAEGVIHGVSSLAISLDTNINPADYSYAAKFAQRLALAVIEKNLDEDILLNVNVPAIPDNQIQGVQITRQGVSKFDDVYDKRTDPRGRVYYWLTGDKEEIEEGQDVDSTAVKNGQVSITPIVLDLTDYGRMEGLRNIVPEP